MANTRVIIAECWFLSKFEKLKIAKALQIYVDEVEDTKCLVQDDPVVSENISSNPSVSKVQCATSPFFYAFCNHHSCYVVIDTGATLLVILQSILRQLVQLHNQCFIQYICR